MGSDVGYGDGEEEEAVGVGRIRSLEKRRTAAEGTQAVEVGPADERDGRISEDFL